MNSKALQLLEFNKIIDLLSQQTRSRLTKDKIADLTPTSDLNTVRDALTETTEAVSVILYRGSIPVGDLEDVKGLLSLAKKGRILTMGELLEIRKTLTITREVKTFLAGDLPDVTIIKSLGDALVPLKELESDIERSIISRSEMADSASPELARIRQEIRTKNEVIRKTLDRMAASGANQKILQDAIVTMRNGRYVIPVKREHASSVPGIVHDQSQSGATLFIEPQSIVRMNNELKELSLAEEVEITRILKEFSERVAAASFEISNNQKILVDLDFMNAKGKLSCLMHGNEPKVNENGYLNIRGGRHPLISDKKAVPIDVHIGDAFTTLLITGPNTGGKTVTLKTIGLFVMMIESGLHIPCYENTEIPLFKEVYADIGDEQSIEQSLSTFSSHMKNIAGIFEAADKNSLVLLDELGAGTDPAEGAALGIAELERLREMGATVVATTHYTELKKYALQTDGVENASMEFDVETLSPTYKLRIGLPGKSNAFEISRKLGLDESIIDRATELMEDDHLDFENAVSIVENERKRADAYMEEAVFAREEAEAARIEAERKLDEIEKSRDDIINDARSRARDILKSAQEFVDDIGKELKALGSDDRGKQVGAVADAKRRLREEEIANAPVVKEPKIHSYSGTPAREEDLKPGTRIKYVKLDQNGEVESLPSKGKVVIRLGSIKTTVKVKDLLLIEDAPKGNKEKQRKAYTQIMTKKTKSVSPSLNVIGKKLDETLMIVDKYIDDAYIAGLKSVTIVHGKGQGILKRGIREKLDINPQVKSYKDAPVDTGGAGATVVELNL